MKFTHYDYKCIYYEFNRSTQKFDKKTLTSNQHSLINLDVKYHTSFISIYTDDTQIEKFSLGITASPSGSVLKDRCQDRLYLNFVLKGQGKVNGIPFSAGQFYYTAPLETHTIETSRDTPFVSAWISLEGTYTQNIINKLTKKGKNKIMPLSNSSDLMELTKTFLYSTNLGETSVEYLKTLLEIYLFYISAGVSEESEHSEMITTNKIAKMVTNSKMYVRKNLRHVTVADMAAAQHYNTRYFSRIFTEAMGIRPQQYITDCRMEWAKNSLAHSNLSISEITEAIGYDHRNGFSIAFKKKYGCSPTDFRRRVKNDAASLDGENE